jgi:mannosyltransferase OCH1-like enzyme
MHYVVWKAIQELKTRSPYALAMLTAELPLSDQRKLFSEVASNANRIPNQVFQTWINCKFGRRHSQQLKKFREMNSDYSFYFFDEVEINNYMDEFYGDHPINNIFKSAQFGPLKTDIWRYCILYERGGVYCDIGKALSVPLNSLIPPLASAVLSYERNNIPQGVSLAKNVNMQYEDKLVINWAMMFCPNHPLLAMIIDGIVEKYPFYKNRVSSNAKHDILRFTGPIHLTECTHKYFREYDTRELIQSGIDFEGNSILDLRGSYVRYIDRDAYGLAHNVKIVL